MRHFSLNKAVVCPKGSGVPVVSETLLVSEIWTEGAAEGLWAKWDQPGGVQFSAGDWTKAERRLVGMGRAIFASLCLARAACTASVWISSRRMQRMMKIEDNEEYRKANIEKNSYPMHMTGGRRDIQQCHQTVTVVTKLTQVETKKCLFVVTNALESCLFTLRHSVTQCTFIWAGIEKWLEVWLFGTFWLVLQLQN